MGKVNVNLSQLEPFALGGTKYLLYYLGRIIVFCGKTWIILHIPLKFKEKRLCQL